MVKILTKDIPPYETGAELEEEDENSPININSREAIVVNMGALQTDSLWQSSFSVLENDGVRGVTLSLLRTGSITHGPFDEQYNFKELHFHWGYDNDDGCEHSIDEFKGAVEAHFVFTREYTIWTDIEYLETAKKFDENMEARAAKLAEKRARSQTMTESNVRLMENEVEEIEEKMILDRWQKEKSKKAIQGRRPTKFEFDTILTIFKDRDTSNDTTGYIDEEEIRRQKMSQDDFLKFKDMIKMQQSARKCAERKAHHESKIEYVKWKANEDALDESIRIKREQEEEKDRADENIIRNHSVADYHERKKKKHLTSNLFRDRIKRDETNRNLDESLRKRRAKDLNNIQTKTIELVCNIAVLFHIDEDAPFYHSLSYLSFVEEPFTEIILDTNILDDFKDILSSPDYYTYHSHQSPTESQGILWIVMKDSFPIRSSQVQSLKSAKSIQGQLIDSNRRIAKGAKRKVYMNREPPVEIPFVCPGKEFCHCDGKPASKNWEQFKLI